tara:strand:- start:118 stop:1614 length:1497 start_codon:yes stop_codon:yes gene_type:complete
MTFSKAELLAEKARRQTSSKPSFSRQELLAEKARRQGIAATPAVVAAASSPPPVDFDAGTMVSNVPKSAKQLASDMVQPFLHPINTANAVGDLASGVIQSNPGLKAAGNTLLEPIAGENFLDEFLDPESMKVSDAVGEHLSDRYGSIDQFKTTAMNDPVGVLSDVAGIFTLGGTIVPKVGGKISKIATAVDPANIAINSVKVASKAIPDIVPQSLYARSAKLGTTKGVNNRNRMIDTALNEGIAPTQKGLDKLDSIVSDEMSVINTLLDEAEANGTRISKGRLLASVRKELNNVSITTPSAGKRKKEIGRVLNDFGKQWRNEKNLTPRQVQDLKQDLGKELKFDSRNQKSKRGTELAYDTLRGEAKTSLEEISPQINDSNSRVSRLLDLKKEGLEQSASRIENRDVLGVQNPLAGGLGFMIGQETGLAAGLLLSQITSPVKQANLAIALRALQNSPVKDIYFEANGTLTEIGRQAVIQSGRLNSQESDQSSKPQQPQQ